MKQIPLTQGKFALVDDDVYDVVGNLKWYASKKGTNWYATRRSSRKDDPNGRQHTICLHHCVIGVPLNNFIVDHKDGNGLNNQRDNLRIVTPRKNIQNRQNHRHGHLVGANPYNPSNYNPTKKWRARIRINGKLKLLGYFKTEQEAHQAYLKALVDFELK